MSGVVQSESRKAALGSVAESRVMRGRLTLMLEQPFLASAIARLPLVDATNAAWCPTAATDGYHVYVNLAFTETLSDADVGFVLAHEVLHCVLGHPDRRGTRERFRWNIAIDYATNALLVETGFAPPARALYERAYAGLTAESIYDTLPSDVHGLLALVRGRSIGNVSTASTAAQTRSTSIDEIHPGATAGYDLHLDSGDLEGGLARTADLPSQEERVRLRQELGRELKTQLAGRAAGYWATELQAGTERAVPWRELLARFVGGLQRADYRLFPPNRKHLWRGLYLPALGVPGPEHLVVAVDTSGSMSTEELSRVFNEIDTLRTTFECRVTVIQCDCEVQRVEQHDPWDDLVPPTSVGARHVAYGRGGTDLRPPFQWMEERISQAGDTADAIIYCTDGYGPFPQRAPAGLPVLWILTHDGTRNVPFGDVVRLPRLRRQVNSTAFGAA